MNITEDEIARLAEHLTDYVFGLGSEPESPCNRLQFMGGQWTHEGGKEVRQGGICRSAFSRVIKHQLIRFQDIYNNTPACDACGDDKKLSRIDEWTVLCEECINEFKGKP